MPITSKVMLNGTKGLNMCTFRARPCFIMLNLFCCMWGEKKSLVVKLRYLGPLRTKAANEMGKMCSHARTPCLLFPNQVSSHFRGEGAFSSKPPSSGTLHARLHTSSLPPAMRLIADFSPIQKSCQEEKERIGKFK